MRQPGWFICSRCIKTSLRSRPKEFSRAYVTSTPSSPPKTGIAQLSSRRLISLNGADAAKYLQGLIAANVPWSSKHASAGFYSAFLNAQGRVLHDVFVYPTQSPNQDFGYLIEVDAGEVDSLFKHLKRYKLRAKVALRIIDDGEQNVWNAWGQNTPAEDIATRDDRIPEHASEPDLGSRIIIAGSGKPNAMGEETSSDIYEIRRMQMGVPEGQKEILKESALPQESNIDYMGGIDFRKGCYVGQELTIRTHHTGVVRKRILPVQLYQTSQSSPSAILYDGESKLQLPPAGANISRVDKKGRSAGRWLGGIGNIGLALCRLEVMTDTILTGEGSQWNAQDEFKITWQDEEGANDKEVRVKAFVPWWHHVRAEEQRVQRPNG